jgi:hypothetical protein
LTDERPAKATNFGWATTRFKRQDADNNAPITVSCMARLARRDGRMRDLIFGSSRVINNRTAASAARRRIAGIKEEDRP